MSAGSQLNSPRISQYDFVRQDPWPRRAKTATRVTVLVGVSILLGVGALICTRRLLGEFLEAVPPLVTEMQPLAMVAVALVSTSIAVLCRIAWRRVQPLNFGLQARTLWTERFVGWGSSLALVLLAVGCCFPGYRNIDWLLWLPLLVSDQFWRQNFFDSGRPGLDLDPEIEAEEETVSGIRPETFATTNNAEAKDNQQVVQQLYRVRDEKGQEVIYGTLRADFHSGQRTAVLHVGFCPPLPYLPEIEADALPGCSARLRIVQALAHGARLDVKLHQTPASDCHLWIDMAATPIDS